MYKQVITPIEQKQFNFIWETCWKEKGFELEYFNTPHQYLFYKNNIPVACIELKEFNPKVQGIFQFCPELRGHEHQIYEIDKLSILKDFRSEGVLKEIFLLLAEVSAENNIKYFVALMEPNLYTSLVEHHFPLKEANERFYYKGDYVVPVLLDVNKALKRLERLLKRNKDKQLKAERMD